MSDFRAADTRKIAVTGTSKEENFGSLCDGIIVSADADCYIDFDVPADTGSQLIKGGSNAQALTVDVYFTRLTAITSGGTANLYVTGLRRGSR